MGARDGVDGFVAHLAELGVTAEKDGPVVRFEVDAAEGSQAGRMVSTAVSTSELLSWPLIPPHWVHFPATVKISPTNSDTNECLPGWLRHSRQFSAWSSSAHPAQAWVAHVRSVLCDAA